MKSEQNKWSLKTLDDHRYLLTYAENNQMVFSALADAISFINKNLENQTAQKENQAND